MTTHLTIWTPAGHFAPRAHEFRYREAAEHLRQIVADLGASAEVVPLDEEGDDA